MVLTALRHLLDEQRADAEQFAVASNQASAAPKRMRRSGENRLIEQIFPIAGELLFADNMRLDRLSPAAACDDDGIAGLHVAHPAKLQGRQVETAQRLDQAKAALLIVSQRVRRNDAAVIAGQPNALRFGDQIADGEDKAAVLDHDAIAGALRAENVGGKSVFRYGGLKRNDGFQSAIEVEVQIFGLWLHRGRVQAGLFDHGLFLSPLRTASNVERRSTGARFTPDPRKALVVSRPFAAVMRINGAPRPDEYGLVHAPCLPSLDDREARAIIKAAL